MTFEEFLKAIDRTGDPPPLSPELKSLWLARRGDWQGSHEIAQDIPSQMGAAIHAYLHRVEGDIWNANYWYSRAGRPERKDQSDLDAEWESLVRENL